MTTFFIYSIIAVVIAYFNKFDKKNVILFMAFIVVFLFMALRFNYGNDYVGYQDMFNDINNNVSDYKIGESRTEIGWILLNKLFKPFGFYAMIAFTSLLSCICYYIFIVKFVEKRFHWLAILIYLFNTNYMLVQLSAMRQSMAIILFMLSLVTITERKFVFTAIIISLAYFFHTSALLLAPIMLIFVVLKFSKVSKPVIIALVSLLLIFYLGGASFAPTVSLLASKIFKDQYYMYLVQEGDGILPNMINILTYALLLLVLLFYYNKIENKEYRFLTNLSIVGIFMLPLGFILPQASRLAFYFLPVTIAVYPYYMKIIDNKLIKILFFSGLILVLAIRLITFFYSDIYNPHFYEYHSLINHIL